MFGVKTETKDGVVVFQISGRLDSAHSKELDLQIIETIQRGNLKIVLDFQNLEYISSSGIRVLVHCNKEIEKSKGSLFLANLPTPIENVLYITGFSPYFKTFDTVEEAENKIKNLRK